MHQKPLTPLLGGMWAEGYWWQGCVLKCEANVHRKKGPFPSWYEWLHWLGVKGTTTECRCVLEEWKTTQATIKKQKLRNDNGIVLGDLRFAFCSHVDVEWHIKLLSGILTLFIILQTYWQIHAYLRYMIISKATSQQINK